MHQNANIKTSNELLDNTKTSKHSKEAKPPMTLFMHLLVFYHFNVQKSSVSHDRIQYFVVR